MEPTTYLALVAATTIMIASPGPSVMLTVAHGVSFGWRRALFTVAGATAGIAVQLAVAAIGLASLLTAVAEALRYVRLAGAVYLVYLGVRQWLSGGAAPDADTPPVTTGNLFIQGLVTTIPNPKSLIFIAAFLPQFVDPSRPIGTQFAIIAPTFLAITFVVTSMWALLSGTASGLLRRPAARRMVQRGAGALTVATGVGLALARRSA
jgi:threonine/homoserine/homoserine lactone efflux protein